jgi:putative flavoprotein involved in K+ transport
MSEDVDVVIVGAGQAGLSVSHELSIASREHVVLERGRVAQTWRGRWDGFHLVLPNWSIRLAGQCYDGPEPDEYMGRDSLVRYLDAYAASFDAPVREGVAVTSLRRGKGSRFHLRTSSGDLTAREVVLATGGYQKPYFPAAVAELPRSITVIGVDGYRDPRSIADGGVLVIGSGQSGCQIAEELHLAGRRVVLACGRAPWLPRRIGADDVFRWMIAGRMMEMTLEQLPSPLARLGANPQTSGAGGGHDLHYRTLQALGVTLVGHLLGADETVVTFAPDLADSVAFGDARYNELREVVARTAGERGVPAPKMPAPPEFHVAGPVRIDAAELGTAIVATGYRPDYRSWIDIDDAFDAMGFPIHRDGSSTVVPGLHFIGVHYQRCRASATLYGVGADAEVVGRRLWRPEIPARFTKT